MSPRRSLAHLRWRLAVRWERVSRGWRYATGRMTEDDADHIRYECELVSGFYPLEVLTFDAVLEQATDRYGDNPELPGLARRACERVHSRWSSTGDVCGAAEEWAMNLIHEYASQDNVVLIDSWNADAEAA